MREAILIGTAPDGTRKVLSGPGHPDPIKAEFKAAVLKPPVGLIAVEVWDSSSGRTKRAQLGAQVSPETAPKKRSSKSS